MRFQFDPASLDYKHLSEGIENPLFSYNYINQAEITTFSSENVSLSENVTLEQKLPLVIPLSRMLIRSVVYETFWTPK